VACGQISGDLSSCVSGSSPSGSINEKQANARYASRTSVSGGINDRPLIHHYRAEALRSRDCLGFRWKWTGSNESATGADATCFHPDNDERLYTSKVVIEEGSEWKGYGDGAQAGKSERLNQDVSYWEFMGVCRQHRIPISHR
jgi:hypothetical protein